MLIEPRPYQQIAVRSAIRALHSVRQALVVMATGLGKTLTAAMIAKEFAPKKMLFLVHGNYILEHAFDEFCRVFDSTEIRMARYNGLSKNGAAEADIVFATWQTMGCNLEEWAKDHFDLVVVDEAHHTGAETYFPVVEYFSGAKLAITATPDRMDGIDIRDFFGAEVENISLERAIAEGWLPRIEYHVITDKSLNEKELQQIVREIREGKKKFTMAEVNRRLFIKKRDEEIAKVIDSYNNKTIVFCPSINHTERMASYLTASDTFHSRKGKGQKDGHKKNMAVLQSLDQGLIRSVCAVNALNEGVNVPSVEMVVFCRVTDSLTILRQQLGRGMRPGKEKLVVLDFVSSLERYKLIMDMMNEIADLHEQYTAPEELECEGYERKEFEVSGTGFEFTFSDQMVDLLTILKHCERDFYSTYEEASVAARLLGFQSGPEYKAGYKQDPKLHSSPNDCYANKGWTGWPEFLGTGENPYLTYEEASAAARLLGFCSSTEYLSGGYKQDPKLPSAPWHFYVNKGWASWSEFLGTSKYPTYEEASAAARLLGFRNSTEYQSGGYKQDPKLYHDPNKYYANKGWTSWDDFLGIEEKYPTYEEASAAARLLGFRSSTEYFSGYKQDPRLQINPYDLYANKGWMSWEDFLGTKKIRYSTYEEASAAARRLGFSEGGEYLSGGYKKDPKLPSDPRRAYANKGWKGWEDFLGTGKYPTYEEASVAARPFGFSGRRGYFSGYKQDPKLPSDPKKIYINNGWISWDAFLGKEKKEK